MGERTGVRARRGIAAAVAVLLAPLAVTTAAAEAPIDGAGAVAEVTETLRVGPLHLDADGNPGSFLAASDLVPRPEGDFVLKGFRADLVYEDGTPVARDDVHLHHIAIAEINVEDPACPGRHAPGLPDLPVRVILASGAERTPIRLNDPFGYSEPAVQWGANYHLVNVSDTAQDIFIEYEIDLLPGLDHPDLVEATPYFMDVAGDCGTAEFDVPGDGGPGSTFTKSADFPMPSWGTILGTGGHLHSGGIATELHAGNGDLICRSTPTTAHTGHSASRTSHHGEHGPGVEAMTQCNGVMRRVEAAEVLRLSAIYDNEEPVAGAMGINITFVAHGWTPPMPQIASSTTTSTTVPETTTTTTAPATPAPAITATPTFTG